MTEPSYRLLDKPMVRREEHEILKITAVALIKQVILFVFDSAAPTFGSVQAIAGKLFTNI